MDAARPTPIDPRRGEDGGLKSAAIKASPVAGSGAAETAAAAAPAQIRTLQTQPTTRYHGNVAGVHCGSAQADRGRRECDGFRGEHGRTRAIRGYLPRIRAAVPHGRAGRERDRGAAGGRGQHGAGFGDAADQSAAFRGRDFSGSEGGAVRQCRSFRDASAAFAAFARAAEDRQLFQRLQRSEAGRFRGARGPRHRPVRRLAASGGRRRERRIHAAALCGRREAVRAAGAAGPDSEISRRWEASSRSSTGWARRYGKRARRA